MEPDTIQSAETGAEAEVMAAVEDGSVETFVLADISRDDAYITMALSEAATLPAWR